MKKLIIYCQGDNDCCEIQDCEHIDWLHLGDGRDICPDCITINDDDNYVTKDGGVYDYETLRLINVK